MRKERGREERGRVRVRASVPINNVQELPHTVQYSIAQRSAVQYSKVQYSSTHGQALRTLFLALLV